MGVLDWVDGGERAARWVAQPGGHSQHRRARRGRTWLSGGTNCTVVQSIPDFWFGKTVRSPGNFDSLQLNVQYFPFSEATPACARSARRSAATSSAHSPSCAACPRPSACSASASCRLSVSTLGLQPRLLLGAGHGGVLRPRLHRRQFSAQVRERLLALLAQRAFLVDLAQRAAFGGIDPLLRDGHLLQGVLQLRRELGTQLLQLPLERLELGGGASARLACAAKLAWPSASSSPPHRTTRHRPRHSYQFWRLVGDMIRVNLPSLRKSCAPRRHCKRGCL